MAGPRCIPCLRRHGSFILARHRTATTPSDFLRPNGQENGRSRSARASGHRRVRSENVACFRTGAHVSEQHEIPQQDLAAHPDTFATLRTYHDPMQTFFVSDTKRLAICIDTAPNAISNSWMCRQPLGRPSATVLLSCNHFLCSLLVAYPSSSCHNASADTRGTQKNRPLGTCPSYQF